MYHSITINELQAHIIMGALALCYNESYNEIPTEIFNKSETKEWSNAEKDLIKQINQYYPDVVNHYKWLPIVEEIKNEE